jgi:hypothetical protein
MPKLAAILNVFAIALTFVPSLNAQQLNFDEENVITITQNDGPKGTGRYKEFYMNVNQGDQLSFDIKGKSGVDVPTVVELYPIRSNITNYRTPRELTKQIWTSAPLPSCQLKIKIIAYPPYGPLSVVVKKSNPNNPPAQQPAPAEKMEKPQASSSSGAAQSSLEIEKMSKAELLQRHREILEELQRIAEEIAKR